MKGLFKTSQSSDLEMFQVVDAGAKVRVLFADVLC